MEQVFSSVFWVNWSPLPNKYFSTLPIFYAANQVQRKKCQLKHSFWNSKLLPLWKTAKGRQKAFSFCQKLFVGSLLSFKEHSGSSPPYYPAHLPLLLKVFLGNLLQTTFKSHHRNPLSGQFTSRLLNNTIITLKNCNSLDTESLCCNFRRNCFHSRNVSVTRAFAKEGFCQPGPQAARMEVCNCWAQFYTSQTQAITTHRAGEKKVFQISGQMPLLILSQGVSGSTGRNV